MPDLFNLPDASVNQQWFDAPGYQSWVKPRGITMAHFLSVNPGAGGGGGMTGATSTVRGGGGGGASGALISVIIPAVFLPDVLYLLVAQGGVGGLPAAAGSAPTLGNFAGTNAIGTVPYSLGSTAQATLVQGGTGGAGVGSAGTTSGGAGASSGSPPTISLNYLAALGTFNSLGAGGGAVGGTAGAGGSLNASGGLVTGGAGGGGATAGNVDSAGGGGPGAGQPAPWLAGNVSGGIAGLGQGPGNGAGGFLNRAPFYVVGGCGGGSFAAGIGGNGGNGIYGGGGGGGGGGLTGGNGGNGGHGLIIVTVW